MTTDPMRLDSLVVRLRALSRYEHDDASIGDEAADEIEMLRSALADARASLCKCGKNPETER